MGILDRISKSGKKVAVTEEKAASKASGKAEQVAAKEATAATKAAKKLKKLGKGLVGARGKKASESIKQLEELARAKISKGSSKANYSSIRFTGTTKVGGKVKDISRRVYQRGDIDWNRVDPVTGLTNKQLAQKGKVPYWNDGTQVELHHLTQREPGPMVEIPASLHDKYHKILHGLTENGNSFRNNPELKKQYNNFRSQYWKWRAGQL